MPDPNTSISITATDNPSTTTAFLLGQLVSKVDAVDKKIETAVSTVNDKVAEATKDIDSLKNFRLKMIAIVAAICTTLNLPGWIHLFQGITGG